ncbi:MAG TPA: hypothetical protein VM076_04845 [Gemmatimonadaceae bacterium]|nr:hypothetical protein [Gemmatimonadaceae bacterium]
MITRSIVATVLIVAVATGCAPGCDARLFDACEKARDLARFAATELAESAPSGNLVVGESDAHHATGLVSIAVRAGSASHSVPLLSGVTLRGDSVAASTAFGTANRRDASFSVEFSAGGLRGVRVKGTRVGAIDVLGSASVLPSFDGGGLRTSSHAIGFGLGMRVGVVGETRFLPAVSVSIMGRATPVYAMKSDPLPIDGGGTATIALESVQAHGYVGRIAASKKFGPLGITAGFGKDDYRTAAAYRVTGSEPGMDTGNLAFNGPRSRRDVAFGGVTLALGRATLAAEAGRVSASRDLHVTNTFVGGGLTKPRTFVTVGVRIPAGRTRDRVR